MAEPKRKPEGIEQFVSDRLNAESLRRRAVAVDPPPAGAIGIQELLGRFEGFAEVGELLDPPQNGVVGIRELLARLANLADAGYFSPSETENSDKQ